MMGERQVRQETLFYGFSLDEHVPADHLLRSIDRFVELSDIRRQLEPFYSAIGRPSVDPELTIGVDADGLMRYRATKHDCSTCALKPRCCPNRPARKLSRSIHEARGTWRGTSPSGCVETLACQLGTQ
jgi:hypothetical protein